MKTIAVIVAYCKCLLARWRYPERYLIEDVRDSIDWMACEWAVIDVRSNDVVGYWAYGNYDPSYPYRGRNIEDYMPVKYQVEEVSI